MRVLRWLPWLLLVAAVGVAGWVGWDAWHAEREANQPGTTMAQVATTTTATISASTTTGTSTTSTSTMTTLPETTTTTTLLEARVWARVADENGAFGGPGSRWMNEVVVGGPGLVAVGSSYSDGNADAAVWTSVDGLVWERVPDDEGVFGGPRDQSMEGVAAGGPGLVAVGCDPCAVFGDDESDAAVWVSADGLAWERVAASDPALGGVGRQQMNGVVAGGPGLVAFGISTLPGAGPNQRNPGLWTSEDGLRWQRVWGAGRVFDEFGQINDLVVTDLGWVAVGYGDQNSPGVWRSEDGLVWERIVVRSPGANEILTVTTTSRGFVAVGFQKPVTWKGGVYGRVWESRTGSVWFGLPQEHGELGDDDGFVAIAAVIPGGPGLVAVGFDDVSGEDSWENAVVWLSSGGVTWERVPYDPEVFGDAAMFDVAITTWGLVAVGSTGPDAAVWVSLPSG